MAKWPAKGLLSARFKAASRMSVQPPVGGVIKRVDFVAFTNKSSVAPRRLGV